MREVCDNASRRPDKEPNSYVYFACCVVYLYFVLRSLHSVFCIWYLVFGMCYFVFCILYLEDDTFVEAIWLEEWLEESGVSLD